MSDLNILVLLRRHNTWMGNNIFDLMSALRIILVCFYHFSITFWNCITTGAISGARPDYISATHELTAGF